MTEEIPENGVGSLLDPFKGYEIKMRTIWRKKYWASIFSEVWGELCEAMTVCTSLLCSTLLQPLTPVLQDTLGYFFRVLLEG